MQEQGKGGASAPAGESVFVEIIKQHGCKLRLRFAEQMDGSCLCCGMPMEDQGGYGWEVEVTVAGESGRVCEKCLAEEKAMGDQREVYLEALRLMDAILGLESAERLLISLRERQEAPFDCPPLPRMGLN